MPFTSGLGAYGRSPFLPCTSTINVAPGSGLPGKHVKVLDVPINVGSPELGVLHWVQEPSILLTPRSFALNYSTKENQSPSHSNYGSQLHNLARDRQSHLDMTALQNRAAIINSKTAGIISEPGEATDEIRSWPNVKQDGCDENPKRSDTRLFSEFEIKTNPSIFRYNYLIIREDAIVGPRQLRGGENGFFNLKSFSSIRALYEATHGYDSWKLWLSLQNHSIEEEWDNPTLEDPNFFNENATLVFVEWPGQYTKGGDALYGFLGNFYIRRHEGLPDCYDAAAGKSKAVAPAGSYERALADLPHLSAALIILQFVEEPRSGEYC